MHALEHGEYDGLREGFGDRAYDDDGNLASRKIPGAVYNGRTNPGLRTDFGPRFNPTDESGIITEPTKVMPGPRYAVLVPRINADGNEVGGVQGVAMQVPLGFCGLFTTISAASARCGTRRGRLRT